MRLPLLVLVTLASLPSLASAQCACGECLGAYADAQRDWEIATLAHRLYQQVEHPARVRALRAEIQYTEARIASLRRLTHEYRPFTRFSTGSALSVTVGQTLLDLLREEQHLRGLRQELSDEQRLHAQRLRLYALEVDRSRTRMTHAIPTAGTPHIEIISH